MQCVCMYLRRRAQTTRVTGNHLLTSHSEARHSDGMNGRRLSRNVSHRSILGIQTRIQAPYGRLILIDNTR